MGRRTRVTLADLSQRTGLSKATISMILAKRSDVSFSEETVHLVRSTARELGYEPVGRKQISLFSRHAVVVICPFILNSYYSRVVQTIQTSAAEMGYSILVYTTYRSSAEEERILRVVAESEVGGVIFATPPQTPSIARRVARSVPVVAISEKGADLGPGIDIVPLHSREGSALVVRHLVDLGHRDVVCISTPLSEGLSVRAKRWEGLNDAFRSLCPEGRIRLFTRPVSHMQLRHDLLLERNLGYDVMRGLLASGDDAFTAVVAINDMTAYGVLDALHEAGRSVPGDYSVCGMDNDYPSCLSGVQLTSVELSTSKVARKAFDTLYLKMCEGETDSGVPKMDDYLPHLVARASTAEARRVPTSAGKAPPTETAPAVQGGPRE